MFCIFVKVSRPVISCMSVGVPEGALIVRFPVANVELKTKSSLVSALGVRLVVFGGNIRTLLTTLLLVKVTIAAFFVASEVLSTLDSPTSDFTSPVGLVMTGEVKVLLVNVATAAFLVISDVLSTLLRPTSDFTSPVGLLITGLVRVFNVKT